MNLLKQDENLSRFASSLYICHTKAMTALVENGNMCFLLVYLVYILS